MKKQINWSSKNDNLNHEELNFVLSLLSDLDPLTKGPWLDKFQSKFQNYIGSNENSCFGLTSAASALEMIALLSDLKENDEILIPAHTYCASAIPFGRLKAKIIWCDIDPTTRIVSLEEIKKKFSKKTKAILVTHLYGLACEMPEISQFCSKNNILLIEDCAQALGAEIGSKKVGTYGDFACFSFHAQKNMSTLGEGGMLVVNNSKNKFVNKLKHNGHEPFNNQTNYWEPAMVNVVKPYKEVWPHNFPLTEIQAAVGWKYLDRVDQQNNLRKKRALDLIDELSEYDLSFQSGFDYESSRHVWHLFPIKIENKSSQVRNNVMNALFNNFGIKCALQFFPLYKYDLFKENGYGNADCPNLEDYFSSVFSIPFHVWMSDDDFLYLKDSLKKVFKEYL